MDSSVAKELLISGPILVVVIHIISDQDNRFEMLQMNSIIENVQILFSLTLPIIKTYVQKDNPPIFTCILTLRTKSFSGTEDDMKFIQTTVQPIIDDLVSSLFKTVNIVTTCT